MAGLVGFFVGLSARSKPRPPVLLAAPATEIVPPVRVRKRQPVPAVQSADDLLSALTNMGYGRPEAEAAAQAARQELPGASLEDLLRRSLRLLARRFFE